MSNDKNDALDMAYNISVAAGAGTLCAFMGHDAATIIRYQAAEIEQLKAELQRVDAVATNHFKIAFKAEDEPLVCDKCGIDTPNPWHSSEGDNRHVHSCDTCHTQQVSTPQPLANAPWLIRKVQNTKDQYFIAEGSPPSSVLEVYGIEEATKEIK